MKWSATKKKNVDGSRINDDQWMSKLDKNLHHLTPIISRRQQKDHIKNYLDAVTSKKRTRFFHTTYMLSIAQPSKY